MAAAAELHRSAIAPWKPEICRQSTTARKKSPPAIHCREGIRIGLSLSHMGVACCGQGGHRDRMGSGHAQGKDAPTELLWILHSRVLTDARRLHRDDAIRYCPLPGIAAFRDSGWSPGPPIGRLA